MPLPNRLGNECPKFVKFAEHEPVGKVIAIHYGTSEYFDSIYAVTWDGDLMTGFAHQFEAVGDEVLETV